MNLILVPVEAVLFDLDGTLVETNIDFARMRREMMALATDAGLDAGEVATLDILAIVERTVEFVSSRGGRRAAAALKARAWSALEEIEVAHARNAEPIPYSRDLLAELTRRRIKVGVVTRNSRRASEIALQAVHYSPDVLVCREDTPRFKPHPDPLRAALRALRADPQSSIMVGDHLMDMQSGRAAGMKTIGFLRDHRPPDFFAQVRPDLVARSLEEVLSAIVGRNG